MAIDVLTLGCRLNACESEIIGRKALAAGLTDTVVVNTCAVTAEAVRQSRQTIRRIKRARPHARIVVTGCAAQIERASFAAMPEVAMVVPNEEKLDVQSWRMAPGGASEVAAPECVFTVVGEEKIKVNDMAGVREPAAHLIHGPERRVRAFVQVQNGCDHRCTFCIIPFGRGNSRSLPMSEVVTQVRRLCEHGCREVVLTGVDLTDYGSKLPGAPALGTLARQILKHVPELPRLRLSSIDSVEADHELLDALASESRLMPHLHLSLQAGDDMILKRMKRRHLRADAVAFCNQLRRLRSDVVFGGDIIAGFPTETEAMFARSLDLVEDCGLTHLHVFPFSPRPGTPAARMPQVAREVVKERARRLRERGVAALRRHLDGEVGTRQRVLTETRDVGRTEQFTLVRLATAAEPAMILDLTVAGH